jgi:ribosome maturation factor RimP
LLSSSTETYNWIRREATVGAVSERVEHVLTPVINDRGLDLELVDVQPAGRRRLVRVLVDRDGGISLDDVAALSHDLSTILDESDAMGEQPYVLEVSSPGVDRPLTLPRHWRRARGRLVQIELLDGEVLEGRVVATTESDATLAMDPATGGTRTVRLPDVRHAQVKVEFNHAGYESTGSAIGAPDSEG